MVNKNKLRYFEIIFNLKINFFESNFGVIGIEWKRSANLLNCKLLVILFVYLGVPICENPRLEAT